MWSGIPCHETRIRDYFSCKYKRQTNEEIQFTIKGDGTSGREPQPSLIHRRLHPSGTGKPANPSTCKGEKAISSLNPDTIVLYGFQQRRLLFSVWIGACTCTNVYNDTQIIVDIFKLVDQPLNSLHSCIHSPLFRSKDDYEAV